MLTLDKTWSTRTFPFFKMRIWFLCMHVDVKETGGVFQTDDNIHNMWLMVNFLKLCSKTNISHKIMKIRVK